MNNIKLTYIKNLAYSELTPNSKQLNLSTSKIFDSQPASPVQSSSEDIVISLNEIQKDEEQKQRKAVNPKIKPLHILNVCIFSILLLFSLNFQTDLLY